MLATHPLIRDPREKHMLSCFADTGKASICPMLKHAIVILRLISQYFHNMLCRIPYLLYVYFHHQLWKPAPHGVLEGNVWLVRMEKVLVFALLDNILMDQPAWVSCVVFVSCACVYTFACTGVFLYLTPHRLPHYTYLQFKNSYLQPVMKMKWQCTWLHHTTYVFILFNPILWPELQRCVSH